jgi:DNA-directed RNA polymerase subunit RPC12/RpoP
VSAEKRAEKTEMDKGFRVSIDEAAELASRARTGGGGKSSTDSYAERIGKTFLDKILERAADGVFGGGGPAGGDALDSLSKTLDVVGKAREAFGIDRRRRDDDDDDEPRRSRGSDDLILRLVVSVVDKFTTGMQSVADKFSEAMKDSNSKFERLLEKLGGEEGTKKKGGDSKLEEMAWNLLQQQLQRNPTAEIAAAVEVVKSLRENLGLGGLGEDTDKDIDMFLARERMRIENKRVDAEIEDMRENREMRSSFFAALPQILRRRRSGSGSEESPLYRYTCDACKHEWLSSQRPRAGDTITCPSCSRTLEIGEIGGGTGSGEETA